MVASCTYCRQMGSCFTCAVQRCAVMHRMNAHVAVCCGRDSYSWASPVVMIAAMNPVRTNCHSKCSSQSVEDVPPRTFDCQMVMLPAHQRAIALQSSRVASYIELQARAACWTSSQVEGLDCLCKRSSASTVKTPLRLISGLSVAIFTRYEPALCH
jgi:hypothetical protein